MSPTYPQRCPHCDSHDVRQISPADADGTGFHCHQCSKVFFAPAEKPPARRPPVKKEKARRARRPPARRGD
jgi:transposase-like protein